MWVSFHLLLATKYAAKPSLSCFLYIIRLLFSPPLNQSKSIYFFGSKLQSMEVYGYPSHSLPSSSSPSPFSVGNFVDRVKEFFRCAVSAVIGHVFSAIFTFFFALVGTLLGAMTGALIGQETESGFVRGAAVGAISGAVFSIEVFESSLVLWQSDESGIGCLLYLIDVIASLLSGRLVRERIGPAMLSAVQSQMGAVETNFEEIPNIFDTGGSKGLPGDSVEKIPKITITSNNNVDASGEKASCSVCLQDFQLGETVRSLPHCHHMFHLPCIDKWLVRHGSCPLCRRDL
ncbi:NEP1-interacting protein 1-like [Diospyros lotus]|uniref:NEP1-interacting protein 1-like n=1 Tax=Diospyros lotus TaxID=55363 RepID=UPI0022594AD3|nr:NEP1-interacting protein 1-like [Diospyros lotus]